MSKADFYRDLVPDVEGLVIAGETAASAMVLITLQDDGVDGSVLHSWVKRKHGSQEGLEAWAKMKRDAANVQAAKLSGLAEIISHMPVEAATWKRIPQFTPWHKWIRENAWENEEDRTNALNYAKILLRRRRLQLEVDVLENAHA